MIPLRDNIPSRTAPVVNYAVIALCGVVFLAQNSVSPEQPSLVERYGMIPVRISQPGVPVEIAFGVRRVMTAEGPDEEVVTRQAAPSAVPALLTMLTCIFLHGGWMHFLGNMWFLHIFGDNVEDRFGHIGYLAFYLACGTAASAAHYLTDRNSAIPTIGASGAIAGVMGAYYVSYPRAKVVTLLPLIIIWQVVVLPASLFLGIWFVIQFLQGTMSVTVAQTTGVAWWAHIGGFAAGASAAWLLGKGGLLRPPSEAILPRTAGLGGARPPSGRRPW